MGRKRARQDSNGSGILSDLLGTQKKRTATLNVDADTYERITQVAEQTGKSRPRVLAAFVKSAYDAFVEEAQEAGLGFDPDRASTGNYKWTRKKTKKKKRS